MRLPGSLPGGGDATHSSITMIACPLRDGSEMLSTMIAMYTTMKATASSSYECSLSPSSKYILHVFAFCTRLSNFRGSGESILSICLFFAVKT